MIRARWWLLTLVVGCGTPEEGPWMRPGEDCLSCHTENGEASSLVWSAAGTVFDTTGKTQIEGASILIVDASGHLVTMKSNGAGNFYTAETLTPPFQSIVLSHSGASTSMPSPQTATAGCNSCHRAGGLAGGPLTTP